MYSTLKAVHVTAVVLSGSGLLLRWLMQLAQVAIDSRALRVLPHVVDTVLLASALALAFVGRFNPVDTPWLAAKLVALPIYIAAGAIALRGAPARRLPAFIVAAVAFTYIVSVALTKQPLGFLSGFFA